MSPLSQLRQWFRASTPSPGAQKGGPILSSAPGTLSPWVAAEARRTKAGVSNRLNDWALETLEHNPEVAGHNWFGQPGSIGIVRQMVTDPYVRASYTYRCNPLRAGLWTVEPAKTNRPIDIECARYIDWNLTRLLDFDYILAQILRYHRDGFSLLETTTGVSTYPMDMFPLHKGRGKGIIITGMDHIPAWTVDRFTSKVSNPREMESFTQYLTTSNTLTFDTKVLDTISDLILRFTQEQEGAIFVGNPTLRSAYGPWFLKIKYMILDGIKHERFALGTPWGKLPPNWEKQDRDAFELSLAEMRVNDKGYLMTPDGYEVSLLETKQDSGVDLEASFARLNTDIFVNVGSQFANLGDKNFGSHALAGTIQEQFGLGPLTDSMFVTGRFNIGSDGWAPIKLMQQLNYPDANPPRLCCRNMPIKNYEQSLQTLTKLIAAGAVRVGKHLEMAALEKLGLPLPEDDSMLGEFVTNLNTPTKDTEYEEEEADAMAD